jgi:hypothetical protein
MQYMSRHETDDGFVAIEVKGPLPREPCLNTQRQADQNGKADSRLDLSRPFEIADCPLPHKHHD